MKKWEDNYLSSSEWTGRDDLSADKRLVLWRVQGAVSMSYALGAFVYARIMSSDLFVNLETEREVIRSKQV